MTSLSVVCAVKDRSRQFINHLTSCEMQEIDDYEFILVDDGSTEDVKSIFMASALENKKYVRLDSSKDRPPAVSFNEGYKQSEGDFLLFLCGDIILSDKDVFRKFLNFDSRYRKSLLTYFLSPVMTASLLTVDWKSSPRNIETLEGFWEYKLKHHSTTNKQNLAAGLTTYATGNFRDYWEYIGVFRNENHHLVVDQDLHLRERCLGYGVETIEGICAYHQFHLPPGVEVGTSYVYKNENQARLLEPAERE